MKHFLGALIIACIVIMIAEWLGAPKWAAWCAGIIVFTVRDKR